MRSCILPKLEYALLTGKYSGLLPLFLKLAVWSEYNIEEYICKMLEKVIWKRLNLQFVVMVTYCSHIRELLVNRDHQQS